MRPVFDPDSDLSEGNGLMTIRRTLLSACSSSVSLAFLSNRWQWPWVVLSVSLQIVISDSQSSRKSNESPNGENTVEQPQDKVITSVHDNVSNLINVGMLSNIQGNEEIMFIY